MADTAGQADIRGININKMAVTYFNEATIFKNECENKSTSSREIRWYQKTDGYLTPTSPVRFGNVAEGTRPFVAEQSWTRNTSYSKKYMLETPWITMEDESDSDVSVFTTNMKEIVDAIAYDLDGDIWNVATEDQSPSNINSVTATAAWDAGSGQKPHEDIFEAIQKIREQTKRKVTGAKIYVSAKGEKDLKTWIVDTGASFTQAASAQLMSDNLVSFAGLPVVVSENVTADYALVGDMRTAVEVHTFKPMSSVRINEEGIGSKARCWYHGISLLVKPKYLALISNTEA